MNEHAGNDMAGVGHVRQYPSPEVSEAKGNIESLVMEISEALSTNHELSAQLEGALSPFLREELEAKDPGGMSPQGPMSEHSIQLRKILGSVLHANDRLRAIKLRIDF